MKYKPWGLLDWVISLSSPKEWYFVGCIATEQRSLCSWKLIRDFGNITDELFFHISDIDSEKYKDQILSALKKRYEEFSKNGGNYSSIHKVELMAELYQIQKIIHDSLNTSASVILDVTTMPKRFFFPILKALFNNEQVKNLLLTYSSPSSYTDGKLYEDPESWKNLPGFAGESTGNEDLIVSIGFLVETLGKYLSENPNHGQIKILIPFPAPLAVLKRTWESVSNIERGREGIAFEKHRVETLDMSSAFDRIVTLASGFSNPVAFAPFGPKPTSAAMCIYAIQKNSSVYYPQPTIYHPEYTIGIRNNDPSKAVSAYWVKHEGENLYPIN